MRRSAEGYQCRANGCLSHARKELSPKQGNGGIGERALCLKIRGTSGEEFSEEAAFTYNASLIQEHNKARFLTLPAIGLANTAAHVIEHGNS